MANNMELQQDESPAEIGQILQHLGSKDVYQREWAENALREKDKDDVVAGLILTLTEESRRQKQRKKRIVAGVLTYMAVMLTFIIFAHKPHMIGMVTSMTGLLGAAFAATQKQKAATKVLAQYDDVRGVGLLVEMLGFNLEKDLRAEIEMALIRLLPRLQASDASLLNAGQRAVLNFFLARKRAPKGRTELTIAILKALEQVGDDKSLSIVTILAEGQGSAAADDAVQVAARECLPFLRRRVELQHAGEQLLRASSYDAGTTAPDELLRPASSSGETEPEQLLRAAAAEPSIVVPNEPALEQAEFRNRA